jgi:3-deoxy-7-phosphoheptulonate synthase
VMIEVHHEPEKAVSDGAQSLLPAQFDQLCRQMRMINKILQVPNET